MKTLPVKRVCFICQREIIRQHKWKLITKEVRYKNVDEVIKATMLVHRYCNRPTSYHPAVGEPV